MAGTNPNGTLAWLERFLPQSRSRAIFIFAICCYTFTIGTLEARLVKILGLWPRTHDPVRHIVRNVQLGAEHSPAWSALLLAPVFESLLVIGIIELLRRNKFGVTVQIAGSTLLICGLHSIAYLMWGFLVLPLFFVGAASYIYWRPISFWTGTLMIILVHFFWNASDLLLR